MPGWRERAGTDPGRKASEGPACGRAVGEAGDGIGEVGDAVVGVDGREVAGEAGGDRRRNGGEEELLVLGGLHVGIRADGLGAEPSHHGLNGRVARVKGQERAGQPDATTVKRERHGYRRPKCQGCKGVEGVVRLRVRERTGRVVRAEQRGPTAGGGRDGAEEL